MKHEQNGGGGVDAGSRMSPRKLLFVHWRRTM